MAEVAIPIGDQDYEDDSVVEEPIVNELDVEATTEANQEQIASESSSENVSELDDKPQISEVQSAEPSVSETTEGFPSK